MEEKKSKTSYFELFIALILIGLTIFFILEGQEKLSKHTENVPLENCNKPAGDFAVEPGHTSDIVSQNCIDGSSPCIFSVGSLSGAIEKCNQIPNLCNRFIYENGTMKIVPLSVETIVSSDNNLFVRQNGITYQGTGSSNPQPVNTVPGSNTPVTQVETNSSTTSYLNSTT